MSPGMTYWGLLRMGLGGSPAIGRGGSSRLGSGRSSKMRPDGPGHMGWKMRDHLCWESPGLEPGG